MSNQKPNNETSKEEVKTSEPEKPKPVFRQPFGKHFSGRGIQKEGSAR